MVRGSCPYQSTCVNVRLCNESANGQFPGIFALQKGIALLVRLAIHLCNADRLRQSLNRRPGHRAAQAVALKAAGCERIFREKASGGRWDRPELHRLLDQLRKDDVLVVWKLDRLSRSLRDVLTIMERLGEAGAGFRSLTEAIDTTTPAGRMMMQMVGAFAEFEKSMLKERTKAGLDAAREEGRIGGRRPSFHLSSRQRSERWFPKAEKPPLMQRDCSKSTQPLCRGF